MTFKNLILFFVLGLAGLAASSSLQQQKDIGKTKVFVSASPIEQIYIPSVEKPTKQVVPPVKKVGTTIKLEKKNTLVLRGPVTGKSMSVLSLELLEMSSKLDNDDIIYLALQTPGGDVFAGSEFIDLTNSIPQKIQTVNLTAISMGFHISQHLDKRYATQTSLFMSHRARVGGLSGQLDGELESRLKMLKRRIDYLDVITAKRLELGFHEYKADIVNELWIHGFDSKAQNVADELVNVTCGTSLQGKVVRTVRTIFGPMRVTFSECPLIKAPLAVKLGRIKMENRKEARETVEYMFTNPIHFFKNKLYVNLKEYDYTWSM